MKRRLQILIANFVLNTRKRRYSRAVKRAKKIANEYHKLDGRCYYVLPGQKGSLMVHNRAQIKELNKQGAFVQLYSSNKAASYGKVDIAWILQNAIYISKNEKNNKTIK